MTVHAAPRSHTPWLAPVLTALAASGCASDLVEDDAVHAAPAAPGEADLDRQVPGGMQVAFVDLGAGPVQIAYTVDSEGMALLDGDIILGTAEEVAGGSLGGTAKPAAIAHLNAWPGGVIPYQIAGSLQKTPVAAKIQTAIDDWNEQTIVRLVPRDPETAEHHVLFTGRTRDMGAGEGQSAVGFQPGAYQLIRLGEDVSTRTVRHEIGHTVGLYHEQSRVDRDQHVTINWDNVRPDRVGNFWTYLVNGAAGLDYGSYDVTSLMHYRWNAFAVKDTLPTIVLAGCAVDSTAESCRPSPGSDLSAKDKRGVTRLVTGDNAPRYRLRNEAANQCLRPQGGSSAAGVPVVLGSCSNTASRRWYSFTRWGTSTPMIINEHSRLCLGYDAGYSLIQADCDGAAAQRFALVEGGWFVGDLLKSGSRCVTRSSSGDQPFMSTSCNTALSSKRWFLDYL
jgi:hypothetical protein